MTTLTLIIAAVRARIADRRRPDRLLTLPPLAPWAGEVPPYVLPAAPLPQRTPGMAFIRERVGLQMAGLLPHTSHRAPDDVIRVRPGWVVADVTAEFQAITSRLVDA